MKTDKAVPASERLGSPSSLPEPSRLPVNWAGRSSVSELSVCFPYRGYLVESSVTGGSEISGLLPITTAQCVCRGTQYCAEEQVISELLDIFQASPNFCAVCSKEPFPRPPQPASLFSLTTGVLTHGWRMSPSTSPRAAVLRHKSSETEGEAARSPHRGEQLSGTEIWMHVSQG